MKQDNLKLVLDATDIVGLIARSVHLKKSGRSFVGLCPFHSERTASFHVYADTQSFHCFGCKASGDAISFVRLRDKLDFLGALELLAREAGITLVRGEGQKAGERQLLIEAQAGAVKFFKRMWLERGKPAREYLSHRGFSDSIIDEFRIGFAPDSWDALLTSPEMKPYSPELLHLGGLLKKRETGDGFYDTFRDRAMFPIRDESGKTIAFGGRVLPGSDNPAKYLNSPETPLFSKSRCAFGLDLARARIVETRTAVIVEGYTDVMMAHQYDVRNVVSVLGTALTESHIQLLKRFSDKIVLLFDADSAGDAAAERSIESYLSAPIEIAIATMPAGKDPDEVLLELGKPGFEAIIQKAESPIDFLFKRIRRQFDSADLSVTDRRMIQDRFLKQLAEMLSASRSMSHIDPIKLDQALSRLAHKYQLDAKLMRDRVSRLARGGQQNRRNPGAIPLEIDQNPSQQDDEIPIQPARQKNERLLLGAVLIEPSHWISVQEKVVLTDFAGPLTRRLAEWVWDHVRNEGPTPFAEIIAPLDDELKSLAVESAQEARDSIGSDSKTPSKDGSKDMSKDVTRDLERLIGDCLDFVRSERQRDEEDQLKSLRTDNETEALRRLSVLMKSPNPRRT